MTSAKRFYKSASVTERDGGFGIALDARTLRTPGGVVFAAPTRALAAAMAAEWEAQGELVSPPSMPLTQLAFSALDWPAAQRHARVTYAASFAETDLCCHRAISPAGLVMRQAAAWDPLVDWAPTALGVSLPVVGGVIAAPEARAAVDVLARRANGLDDFRLAALAHAAGLSGSSLIGFALLEGFIDADAAFAAAALDELWSLETWGEDAEARGRLDRLQRDFAATGRFLAALSV
jgi:chaperone required for assembly of F1-ATPase